MKCWEFLDEYWKLLVLLAKWVIGDAEWDLYITVSSKLGILSDSVSEVMAVVFGD